jgi:hypothetical protein
MVKVSLLAAMTTIPLMPATGLMTNHIIITNSRETDSEAGFDGIRKIAFDGGRAVAKRKSEPTGHARVGTRSQLVPPGSRGFNASGPDSGGMRQLMRGAASLHQLSYARLPAGNWRDAQAKKQLLLDSRASTTGMPRPYVEAMRRNFTWCLRQGPKEATLCKKP